MASVITVNELLAMCKLQVKKGNGNKQILISCDDEGNGFHSLFYGFTDGQEEIEHFSSDFHDDNDPKEVILLG